VIVGEYTPGLLVEDQVIAELTVVAPLSEVHLPQSRNDLRATGEPLCLLINFGRPKVEIRRVTPPLSRAQSPKPDRENHPASSLLIPLIRLQKENRPPHSGIACVHLGKGRQAPRRLPAGVNAALQEGKSPGTPVRHDRSPNRKRAQIPHRSESGKRSESRKRNEAMV
jgi:hypothetical protein